MATPSLPIDPTRCPLCGQPNACANEVERLTGQPQPPCWCTSVRFDPSLLARLPPSELNQRCICRNCAAPSLAADEHPGIHSRAHE